MPRDSSTPRMIPCFAQDNHEGGRTFPFRSLRLLLAAFLAVATARADTVVLPANRDASIVQGNPNNSNGGGPCFFAGTDGNTSPHRALISFSLNGIPQGATITSVQLTLTLAQVAGSGGGGSGQIAHTATI